VKLARKAAQWFTLVDPMAADYAPYTPYHYTLNNPIRFIDPDGRSVETIIVGGQKWTPGAQATGQSKFVQETFTALNQIVSGTDKNASAMVTFLANTPDYEIEIQSSQVKTEAAVTIFGPPGGEVTAGYQLVYFDIDRGLEDISTGDSFSPDVALVHELGHIKNAIDNPGSFVTRKKTPNATWKNEEEREVIQKYEIPYAQSRKMLQRTSYSNGYQPKQTSNSTSNK
jgi:hypothetical protein